MRYGSSRMSPFRWVLLGALALSAVIVVDAQASRDRDAFVGELVEAINSKNLERRKALLHPRTLPCASGDAGAVYAETVARQARRGVPAGFTWRITPVPADQPLMFADQLDYPVRPTHLLQLDFSTGPNSSTTMILQLVYDANRWHELAACPKAGVLEAARAAGEARAKLAKKVEALAASTPAALRDVVVRLVNEGRRIEAFKHFASATGEDLATSKAVVELLAESPR